MESETPTESGRTSPYVRQHPVYDGVQAVDPIEETQFSLLTDEPVDPTPCDTDRFYFPVDTAATIEASELETSYRVQVIVRDSRDGTMITEVAEEQATLPAGRYDLDLEAPGLKVYLGVTGGLEISPAESSVDITVTGVDKINVGVRSLHEKPAATVTTTDDPIDIMDAMSTLGSALKMTNPERSFPTVRGHPPLFERGDELDIPPEIETPDNGMVIESPPDIEYLYPLASLAYYLGANVKPGIDPRLLADGESIPLEGDCGFEETVSRTLKQVFLLDCVTRTEGFYDVDLHERSLVEAATDLNFAQLYDRPLAEQVRRYLSVPYDRINHAVPAWRLTVDLVPRSEHVSTLPFIAYELATIRCPDPATAKSNSVDDLSDQIEEFFRADPGALARRTGVYRSESDISASETEETVFRPEEAESVEQAYVGDGIPYGASKMTVDAYQRRLEFEPSSEPIISIAVVCNDPRMADENVVSDIYGAREWIEFDIAAYEGLTTDELRSVLESERDFLHYIGHVDDEGIRCTDGFLDAEDLGDVGTTAFMLNACNSYSQGRALVDSGAMAGITTVTDVLDKSATAVGRTIAQLLNQGFSLSSTIPLISKHEAIGHHYVVVGDGSLTLVENESGTPYSASIERAGDGSFSVSIYGYPNMTAAMGALFTPHIQKNETYYLNSGEMDEFIVSYEDLKSFLTTQNVPVEYKEALTWSYDLEILRDV